ncbi:HPP family protein (plasmid) [Streptomyces sp. BI20]|uniref:HPP family protein n=1 Tax=Streptomyces sp. BI20 TaxID=3403460 RepID=UPI003C7280BC
MSVSESPAVERVGTGASAGARAGLRARLVGRAPARPAWSALGLSAVAGGSALALLVLLGVLLDHAVLVPSLAASAALVFAAPALPPSQPRGVIGGQVLSALTGFAVLGLAGGSPWAAALAGGLAIGVMGVARAAHPPAAATAVIVVLSRPEFGSFVGLLAAATVVLVGLGILAARAGRGARYPAYWW